MIDDKIALFEADVRRSFKLIERVTVMRNPPDSRDACDVEVVFVRDHETREPKVHVRFCGAANVALGSSFGGIVYSFIQITDIHSHQLEDLRYRVIDEEAGEIALLCRDFIVSIEGKP